ncbi:TPA: right-handed parallel beta-helix repeat-containing protein [Acinetobacter baumannii]|nr:right-handed parallel beta-helix repeat-containing protein [Acinetobacter baumannii]HCW3968206.1 right-handed parallel beta-helix repeat-containing protein [Acinetobacter baumannii]
MKLRSIFVLTVISIGSQAHAEFVENTDITSYVNSLIEKNKTITIPDGNYLVSATKSIQLKDNSTLKLSPNTVLNVIPTSSGSYRVFKIRNVKNVNISGGKIIGDKYTHLGETGEWGMGIEIRDSQNISISNISIDKMWGDAIYVGTNGKNSNYNINLNNLLMSDNRRQGISIISVTKLTGSNIRISNTKGADPASGVDIEPNNKDNILQDIYFKNLITLNNAGTGFIVSLKRYANSPHSISIKLASHTDVGSKFGFVLGGNPSLNKGSIEISGTNYESNKHSNFCFNQWKNRVNVSLKNIKHDKENKTTKNSWCFDYKNSSLIKFN